MTQGRLPQARQPTSGVGAAAVPAVAPMVVYCARLLRERLDVPRPSRGLVVGCGNGDEVVYLRGALNPCRAVGLDVEARFSSTARAEQCVVVADAEHLPCPSEAFEFAASFHSLEHVQQAQAALDEIRRVLRPGGWFYVGVPNKSRLVGYLGSFDATTWQKISWNLIDWAARLRGRFDNRLGAHAGFDRDTLLLMLRERFARVEFLTEQFLRFKYANRLPDAMLDILLGPALLDYSAASHYALCQKQQ